MVADAPPQKAIPIIFVVIGVLSIPVIWETIIEMVREVEYGGVIIDTRREPPEITNSKMVPADFVFVVRRDGTVDKMESQSFTRNILAKLLTGMNSPAP
jgi:hypothetical protein